MDRDVKGVQYKLPADIFAALESGDNNFYDSIKLMLGVLANEVRQFRVVQEKILQRFDEHYKNKETKMSEWIDIKVQRPPADTWVLIAGKDIDDNEPFLQRDMLVSD